MKIDLIYPKIPYVTESSLKKCWAFEKYDGTNMHWVFKKYQFISFGTRRDSFPYSEEGFKEFAQAHPEIADAPKFLNPNLEEYLFTYHSGMSGIVFTEFLGPNSFAGQHQPNDAMRHVIIDFIKGKKFLPPDKFLELFEGEWRNKFGWKQIDHARVIYKGKYSGQLIEDIRNNKYNVNEGAVIKGIVDKAVFMAKVKTNDYLKRLEEK